MNAITGRAKKPFAFAMAGLVVSTALAYGIWNIGRTGSLKDIPRGEQLLEEIRHGFQPELAKLLFVLEHYRDSHAKVTYDGAEYDINAALGLARNYLRRNYHGEAAETWIKTHLTRSPDDNELITFKSPDGHQRLLADVLLEELRRLPA